MRIAGIRFRENWRIYEFDATDVDVAVGDDVIVESDRGLGFARVVRLREAEALPENSSSAAQDQRGRGGNAGAGKESGKPEETEEEIEIDVETPGSVAAAAAAAATATTAEKPKPPKGHRKVLRKATEDDYRRDEKNHLREEEAFKSCQDLVAEREMPMKLIRAEYSFDASRVTFYFFSETRVDFRELVKDLAHKLRSRIEMRQVGVRDVARMIGGFGPCGRELCCTSFLRNFEPVSIRMAKKQDMVLNPAKISGVCGRLLCCLSYEFGMYEEIKKDIAEMKETVVREKRAEEERKVAAQRQEAEEQRKADEQRRQEDDRRKQEQRQKQREKQRPGEQPKEGKGQEKKKEGRPEQKQRQPQEQKQRDRQQREKQQARPQDKQQQQQQQQRQKQEQQAQQGPAAEPAVTDGQEQVVEAQQGEGKKRNKRRFWRRKKKKGGSGGGEGGGAPQQGPASS
ncbi:MAG: regulatory iron-sulfur-containing complex subunit RicT [Nitrospiraceae bacterium]|nr:regulatory iron-sulfur-containing complex subunit RicT [Nitrospiraceae bacterium]